MMTFRQLFSFLPHFPKPSRVGASLLAALVTAAGAGALGISPVAASVGSPFLDCTPEQVDRGFEAIGRECDGGPGVGIIHCRANGSVIVEDVDCFA